MMNKTVRTETDRHIRRLAKEEHWNTPSSLENRVEHLLDCLPDTPKEEEMRHSLLSGRKKYFMLAAALAAVLGTTAAAAELFSWHEKAAERFGNPTKEEQNIMTQEGIAQEQKASVSDAGITITAVQTMQDKNSLYILLEIDAEEDIIDGNGLFGNAGADGSYAPEFVTKDKDAFNNIGMAFTPDTPSFGELSDHGYYEIFAVKTPDRQWREDEISIQFSEYSYYTYENHDTNPHKVEGSWTLTLPLGEAETIEAKVYEPEGKAELSGVPVAVKRVELSPLSIVLVFDMDDVERLREKVYGEAEDVFLYELQPSGFLDEAGQKIPFRMGGMSGDYDYDSREIRHVITLEQFADTEKITALLLGGGEVPITLK